VLAGDAGIGKTHLARALLAAHVGYRSESIAGTQALSLIPFGAFARFIDCDPASPQVALLRAIGRRLGRQDQREPIPVLMVDDAHLLDAGSAAVVHQLATAHTVRLILTVRTTTACPDTINRIWRDGYAVLVPVAPLRIEQLTDMVAGILGGPVDPYTIGRLYQLTGGNALAVVEIVAAARADGTLDTANGVWRWRGSLRRSPGVERLLATRLAASTLAERDALLLVALADPLETDVLAELVDPALIESMTEQGLLRSSPSGDVVSLPHPLYGDVLCGAASAVTLRRLRRALALRLHRPEDVLRRVSLMVAAADTPSEVDLVNAARQAVARLDGVLGEQLTRLLPTAHRDRSLLLAGALSMQRRFDEVETLLASATDAEPERFELIGARVTNLVRGLHRTDLAVAFLDALADRAGVAGSPMFALLRLHESVLLRRHADAAAACADDPYLAHVDVNGPAGWAIQQLAGAYYQLGRVDDALTLLAAHIRAGVPTDILVALRFGTIGAQLAAGRPVDAEQTARSLLRLGIESDLPDAVCLGQAAIGEICAYRGDYHGASTALRQALAIDYAPGTARHWMLCRLAIAEAGSGQIDAAWSRLGEAKAFGVDSSSAYLAEDRANAQAYVLACAGEVSAAAHLLTDLIDGHLDHGAIWPALDATQLLARIGQVRPARALLDRFTLVGPLAQAHIDLVRALADDSAVALLRAAADYERLGALGLAAEAATAASAAGGRTAAAAARVRDRLVADSPVTALPWWRGGNRLLLSLREREIAQQAAAGRSNAEIAEHLVLSVRTVENHLHAIYAKLGVTGRGELAAALS
jgi:DNA-binding CsgD family transcriptional regulator